ncbi:MULTISPECIES: hypothetical protein [unclassified Micromonospora]|uniref:hypothetical protein n=1 Tax=unclassified Micromonospora TaxID=2617518 RepID=UPI002FF3A0C1
MQRFKDDDEAYLSWVSSNPEGYVVNSSRSPSPSYLILHRASCKWITELSTEGRSWTTDYIKICGHLPELERWAHDDVGGRLQPCAHCA